MSRYSTADVEKTQAPMSEREWLAREKAIAYDNQCGLGQQAAQQARPTSDADIVAELFRYHPPNDTTIPKYASINQAAKNFAEIVLANCPPGADRSAAISCIRMARMTANAAISLNGLSLY